MARVLTDERLDAMQLDVDEIRMKEGSSTPSGRSNSGNDDSQGSQGGW